MEKNKKFLAVLLTIALLGVLAACENSSEESSSQPASDNSAQNEDGGPTDRNSTDSEGNEAENSFGSSDNTQLNEQEDTENSSAASNEGESVESTNDQIENHESNKDEYLKKLKKMEEADRYAEAKTTTAELVEQETERYRTWDEELNKIYGLLEVQLDKGQMDQLREEQRSWIQQRDEAAKKSSLKYKGGSMEPLEYVATQASLTRERCYFLVVRYMK
ncbi:lysozyme inhibitor LprI family protein [Cytobacillus sp. BC1816]|uniref:lysozyme inhibitor LprI family protein n=1 Tax=Cytobacillus sp. BC1816 TaxID=3440154 RepID=UPI003F514D6F